jgi:hypothetical protein
LNQFVIAKSMFLSRIVLGVLPFTMHFCVQKLNVFVFDHVLVLSRATTRGSRLKYQVYRQPIPLSELVIDDVHETSKQGSFKSAFASAVPGVKISIFLFDICHTVLGIYTIFKTSRISFNCQVMNIENI